jgi:hypothetical protein
MIYILYSASTSNNLHLTLGLAEYSYFFLRETFRAMLEKRYRVIVVEDPEHEVDAIYDKLRADGESCVLLSFAPPHKTCLGLQCPTIPIFAWEYDTIPCESWDDEPRHDWTHVLSRLGHAITLSQYAVDAVKSAMGRDFPIVSIPAPVWNEQHGDIDRSVDAPCRQLKLQANVLDSRDPSALSPAPETSFSQISLPDTFLDRKSLSQRVRLTGRHFLNWYRDVVRDLLPAGVQRGLSILGRQAVRLGAKATEPNTERRLAPENQLSPPDRLIYFGKEDIVYTSVFNPYDARKNWIDLVTAFCSAFSDRHDVTLLLKFVHHNNSLAMKMLRDALAMMPPFKCRVIAIDGHLDGETYRAMIHVTTYVVNGSSGEGLCLPLMEFMSRGKPAIGPHNTALCDYLDEDVAFIVNSSKEICCWPHDTRIVFRAHRYRIDWQSLRNAYSDSHRLAKEQTARYQDMAERAAIRLRGHCSEEVVNGKLQDFVRRIVPSASPSNLGADYRRHDSARSLAESKFGDKP